MEVQELKLEYQHQADTLKEKSRKKKMLSDLQLQARGEQNKQLAETTRKMMYKATKELNIILEKPHTLRGDLRKTNKTLKQVEKRNEIFDRNKELKRAALHKLRDAITRKITSEKLVAARLKKLHIVE